MQPKTIDAYSRALRSIGARFKFRINDLSEKQFTDYFTELLAAALPASVTLRSASSIFSERCARRTTGSSNKRLRSWLAALARSSLIRYRWTFARNPGTCPK
jgi:hypothetical protein